MSFVFSILFLTLLALLLVILVKEKWKGNLVLIAVLVNGLISSSIAIPALLGNSFEQNIYGGLIFGNIAIRIDALSGWFILLMNFTVLTGILYGRQYMKHYTPQSSNLTVHYTSYLINHLSMIGIYSIQNSLAFLCVWELMAITSFLMIIFEHQKMETLKAGMKYLIQSHISIMSMTIGFIWINSYSGSYDFLAITPYSSLAGPAVSFILFLLFFIAFGIKAGFVPFHTWLPDAHPAAPSHVSGMMSGVIIKLGIFGLLRMLLLIKVDLLFTGYFILVISVITGIYGVMLAIVQHNLKKLLAYHSIENIGIIGIGIGIGCIGMGLNNYFLIIAGFGGALMHTLNHSLFKSLLFYCAGTVFQVTHTLDIEKLGGLIKKLPQTSTLFLLGALAICGLPPFNGFISEFLIYSGLFHGIQDTTSITSALLISSIFGLVIIGGMAMLCFTKAFGIIFLGKERQPMPASVHEAESLKLFPKYLIAISIIFIGILPSVVIRWIIHPVSLFMPGNHYQSFHSDFVSPLQSISIGVVAFILLAFLIYRIKKVVTRSSVITASPTWGCGYSTPSPHFQYSANSFVRPFRKLIRPFLMMNKKEGVIKDIFPKPIESVSHPYDKMEAILIDIPLRHLKGFIGKFNFLQNGNPQFYILYGVVFIFTIMSLPWLSDFIVYIVKLFKQI